MTSEYKMQLSQIMFVILSLLLTGIITRELTVIKVHFTEKYLKAKFIFIFYLYS